MGWNDREPYFSMIHGLIDEEGIDYETALERTISNLADQAEEYMEWEQNNA